MQQKSSIQDIKNLLTNFARRLNTLYEQKFSHLRPFLSITFPQGFQKSKKFGQWAFGSGGKKTFKRREQIKKSVKNFFCGDDFTPLMSISFQIWDQKVGTLDFGKRGQKTVKQSEKVWRTNKQTNRHADILTYRRNRPNIL